MTAAATATQALPHQKERDDELRAWALDHLKERWQDNRSAFAAELSFSRSTLSKWLDNKYAADTSIERALRQYKARLERSAADGQFATTQVARIVMDACRYAMERRKLVAVVGPAGNGKTTAIQEFFRRVVLEGVPANSLVFVTARSVTSASTIIRRIAQELNVQQYGVADTVTGRVIDALKRDPRVIVVDDAGFLNVKALHLLRCLYDEAGAGVVLIGVRELMNRMLHATGRIGEDLAQIRSRVGLLYELPLTLSRKEMTEIARRRAPELSDEEIETVTAKQRCARSLVHLVERVQWLRKIHPANAGQPFADIVRAAESQILEDGTGGKEAAK